MSRVVNALSSQVGRKFLTGITGISLSVFVLIHLLGNLQIFIGAEVFNKYAHTLESFGPILWVLELGLLAVFVIHAILGTSIYLKKKKARPINYQVYNSAGNSSYQTSSSKSMIVTGSVLLIFTAIHILTFKFGPGIKEGYVTMTNNVETRDLYRLVIEKFQNPLYTGAYMSVMILLGLHLRHGVWSSIQSLGALNTKYRSAVYTFGLVFAFFIATGFLVLPAWIYFSKGGM